MVNVADRKVCFSNRAYETETLRKWVDRGIPYPIAVYGPEGCGKTTLFRYFVKRIQEDGYVGIYVNALGVRDLSEVVEFPRLDVVNEVLREVIKELHLPLGTVVSKYVSCLVSKLVGKISGVGRGLILVLDDVYKAIGLGEVDRYTKMLYEWITWKLPELDVRRYLVVLTTSEGVSKRELLKHTYVHTYMLWNLPLNGFYELLDQLNPPMDYERIWRITGGNPRLLAELIELEWSVDKLIERYREKVLRLLTIGGISLEVAKQLAENSDSNPRYALKLEELGLMVQLMRKLTLGKPVIESYELGVGKEWAWQTPIYKDVLLS